MNLKLNSPYTVSGTELQAFLRENDCHFQAEHQIDPAVAYKVLVWVDAEKYETKKNLLEGYKKGSSSARSAYVTQKGNFYQIMFQPTGTENLTPHPGYVMDKVKETGKTKAQKEKFVKVMEFYDSTPRTAEQVAALAGVAYPVCLAATRKFLAEGLIEKRKDPKWTIGKGRPRPLYVRKQ